MIEIKEFGFEQFRELLNPENLRKATREALQNTRNKAATFISKKTRERYYIESGAIARRLKMGFVDGDAPAAVLQYIGSRIGLINFSAKSKKVKSARGPRTGATFQMLRERGRVLSTGGFIAAGKEGNVQIFARKTKARDSIVARHGPSIPQMVGSEEVVEAARQFVAEEFPAQYANKLQRFFEIQVGLR